MMCLADIIPRLRVAGPLRGAVLQWLAVGGDAIRQSVGALNALCT